MSGLKCLFLALLGVVVLPQTTHAKWVSAHPRFGAGIGWNLLLGDPSKPHSKCITHDPVERIHGATSATFKVSLATERSSLFRQLGRSVEFEASFGIGGMDGKMAVGRRVSFTSDSITFVASFFVDFGVWGIKRWTLSDEFADATPEDVLSKCGDSVVTRERRGAKVAVVYTARNLSSEERSRLIAMFSGETLVASAKNKFSEELRRLSESTYVETEVFVTAGDAPSGLAGLFEAGSLDGVRAAMVKYVSGLNPDNAGPLEYGVEPLGGPPFPGQPELTELFVQSLDTEAELALAASCPATRVDPEVLKALRDHGRALEDAWKRCKAGGECPVRTARPQRPVCRPPYVIHVEAWTGTGSKSGTNDIVHLVVSDSKGVELTWRLDNPGLDDFQPRGRKGGATDRFSLKNDVFLTDVKCVELRLSTKKKSGRLDDLKLSRLEIRRDSLVGRRIFTFGDGPEHLVLGDGRPKWRKCN